MCRVILDRVRLPASIRINQRHHHKACIIYATRLRHCERVTLNGLNRSSHVDNLHAAAQQLLSVFRKVLRYALERRSVRLINVHALDWAAKLLLSAGAEIGGLAPDRVVEDVDAGCACAVES
jgi:hypothetical protein